MKEKVFKYALLAMTLINIWSLYMFFDYFLEDSGMFNGLGLFFHFVYTVMFALGLSIILLIIRTIFFLRKRQNLLKTNFLYIFSGIFNLNIFIIWVTCIVLKIFELEFSVLDVLAIGSFLIALFIIVDIYKSVFLAKHQ